MERERVIGSHKVILNANTDNLFTAPGLRKETSRKLGSAFKPGSRDIVRGLTPEEEKEFLPFYIGVKPTDNSWFEKVQEYWANFAIPVGIDGLTLEMGFKEDDKGNLTPIDFEGYMKGSFAMNHPDVTLNEDEKDIKKFFIVDLAVKKKEEAIKTNVLVKADIAFSKLVSDDTETGSAKRNFILWLIGETPSHLDDAEKIKKLRDYRDNKPSDFISMVSDPELNIKAFVRRCMIYEIIKREGDTYWAEDVRLGASERDTLEFLKSPENSAITGRLKDRLKSQTV